MILYIDNFKGVVRELLLDDISNIGQEENLLIEVFIESGKFYPSNLSQCFRNLRFDEGLNYNCYVKVNQFIKCNSNCEKIFVCNVLQNYFESLKKQGLNKNKIEDIMFYEFSYSDMLNISKNLIDIIKLKYNSIQQSQDGKADEDLEDNNEV